VTPASSRAPRSGRGGARLDPDGPPLEAPSSSSRVKRVLERRSEAAEEVEAEWERLPAEARERASSPDDLFADS
jgi:hypothetical protein